MSPLKLFSCERGEEADYTNILTLEHGGQRESFG